MAEISYSVIGQTLYRLNRIVVQGQEDSFTYDALGTVEGGAPVSMDDNGDQLCIVARPDNSTTGKSYIFTEPSSLVEITDPDFDGPATSVLYIDGFFNFVKADGKKFFNSALQDGLNYDPLDFSQAFVDPDPIKAQGKLNNQLYIFGSETIQPFRNIGRSPAPFQATPSATIDVGISSQDTLQKLGGVFVFVGSGENESPSIWSVKGVSKNKISTTPIDNILSSLSEEELNSLTSWVYSDEGGFFYGLNLPDTCLVYDASNSRWHERLSKVGQDQVAYRVAQMSKAYNRIIVTDRFSGIIGELRTDIHTEYDNLMRRFITTRPFDNVGNSFRVARIEATIESGVGLTNDITLFDGTTELGIPIEITGGSEPKITLSTSKDWGRTFQGHRSRSMGKRGEYRKRPVWNRLGRFSKSVVLKFEVASPTKSVLIKAEASVA
jgi:hypothetical protein